MRSLTNISNKNSADSQPIFHLQEHSGKTLYKQNDTFIQKEPPQRIFETGILMKEISLLKNEINGIRSNGINFIKINMLSTIRLRSPLDAVVEPDDDGFIARTTDIPLFGFGDDPIEAVNALKCEIESLYNDLMEDENFSEEWLEIKIFLRDRIDN